MLIPKHGALGAAVAWTVGIVVENVLVAVAARAAVGEPLITRPVLWAAAVAGGGAATLAGLGALLAGRGVAGLGLTIGLLAITCAMLLLNRRARRAVRSALAMLRPGTT